MTRVAKALEVLRAEINGAYPDRDRRSDGAQGDSKHASRPSDHNPNAAGVVRARDFDEDLTPNGNRQQLEPLVDYLVSLGKAGDRRLNPDGYVIYEGRIWSSARNWVERGYTGPNAHDHHAHVSVSSDPAGYDNSNPWGVDKLLARKPTKKVRRDRWLGLANPPMTGNDVRDVHNALIKISSDNAAKLAADYDLKRYGRPTADVIALYQRNRGLTERGCGPRTLQHLRDEVH